MWSTTSPEQAAQAESIATEGPFSTMCPKILAAVKYASDIKYIVTQIHVSVLNLELLWVRLVPFSLGS